MSKENPGVIFDASSSWNGFNHQGKLAIWYAIKEIKELYANCDQNTFQTSLDEYFLEIEHMEDFSVGRIQNGKKEYLSVHQVKNYDNRNLSKYDSAILGLVYHFKEYPNIEHAYLHITKGVTTQETIVERAKNLSNNPEYLSETLSEINVIRTTPNKKASLIKSQRSDMAQKLKEALRSYLGTNKPVKLASNNIDEALDLLEKEVKEYIDWFNSVSDDQFNKIALYPYEIGGTIQEFCRVDQMEKILQDEIKEFTELVFPEKKEIWNADRELQKRYLYMLGRLDDHVVERNLHLSEYKKDKRDRTIKFRTIFDWLSSEEFSEHDEALYVYKLKERFIRLADERCFSICANKGLACENCNLELALKKIRLLEKEEIKRFLHQTYPEGEITFNMNSLMDYGGSAGIKNPFLKGLREIEKDFSENEPGIVYEKNDASYVLTTLNLADEDELAPLCARIVENRYFYEMLMDYEAFISKDGSTESILDTAGYNITSVENNIRRNKKKKAGEHIAKPKQAKLITLEEFKKLI